MLLTPVEIKEIETNAFKNPALRLENAIGLPDNGHKSILKISPVHGLIFFKGNEDTGFEHIHSRHEFWSTEAYWKTNDEGETKLDNPSRFPASSIPIVDYILIGDAVYGDANTNREKNHDPNIFDMYSGEYAGRDGAKTKYHLLTYKGTKLVHTLYPQSQKNNPKKPDKFHFTRGAVTGEEIPANNIFIVKIPYLNSDDKTIYSIQIVKYRDVNREKAFVFIHDENEKPKGFVEVGERDLQVFKSDTYEMITYQHTDLRNLERIILDIHNKSKT